jgi:pyruvate formate lyase activating enzyme
MLEKDSKGIMRNRAGCKSCGKCAEECPSGAQELLGKEVTLEDLLAELMKDKVYYDKSGGGVTLSGGEPLMQADFSSELLRRLKENGISTAVDTCGLCAPGALEKCLPFSDLVLFDVKEIDPARHKEWTGVDNRRILNNLLFVRDFVSANPGTALWIRTPLIPGATANPETIGRIGSFMRDNLGKTVERWELCAFNNLCRDKYRRLDMEWAYASTPLMSKNEMQQYEALARSSGPDPESTFVTGAARVEN